MFYTICVVYLQSKIKQMQIQKSKEMIQENGNKMTALVAGGAGVIGSHLCDRLIMEGYNGMYWQSLIRTTWKKYKIY